jgi:galactose oxidase
MVLFSAGGMKGNALLVFALSAALHSIVLPALAQPPNPEILPRDGFTAAATSENGPGNAAGLVLDGSRDTIWQSERDPVEAPLPHSITIDFGGSRNVAGLVIVGRHDDIAEGHIGAYTVSASDGGEFAQVAEGTFADSRSAKTVTFAPRAATALRITANSEAGGRGPWAAISEVDILGYLGEIPATQPQDFGEWSPVINMPLVPVAAALLPNGKVWCSPFHLTHCLQGQTQPSLSWFYLILNERA